MAVDACSIASQDAAAKLNLGVTTLKKICRQFSIKRWPYRKRSSIDKLIKKTRSYLDAKSSNGSVMLGDQIMTNNAQ